VTLVIQIYKKYALLMIIIRIISVSSICL